MTQPKDKHARIDRRISNDEDYRTLTRTQQHLYLTILARPDMKLCGVADWRPGRITVTATDWPAGDLEADAAVLIDRRYIVVDTETEEVLVRSFVRHDGIMAKPNMVKAMVKQAEAVTSSLLRGVIVHELIRFIGDFPDTNERSIEAIGELISRPAINPWDDGLPNPYRNPFTKGLPNPSANPSRNPSGPPYSLLPSPYSAETAPEVPALELVEPLVEHPPVSEYDFPGFNEFWQAYPRKDDKKAALKAFKAAIKRSPVNEITDGAKAYAQSTEQTLKQHIKLASTWLNGDCWHNNYQPTNTRDTDPVAYAHRNNIPENFV